MIEGHLARINSITELIEVPKSISTVLIIEQAPYRYKDVGLVFYIIVDTSRYLDKLGNLWALSLPKFFYLSPWYFGC